MGDNYDEFCQSAEKANAKSCRGDTFPRYGMTLKYDSEGIYSYGDKIANLDLKRKTIQKLGYRSPMSNRHYKYAAHMFKICYDFHEVLSPCDLIHIQHLSYDDHT
jgi:hypothetical protein